MSQLRRLLRIFCIQRRRDLFTTYAQHDRIIAMNKKRFPFPYLFLAGLLLFLMFGIGLRYGERVERTNKTIQYLISLPPSPSPAPTYPPFELKTFNHKGCGISFSYPNTFAIENETTHSAVLKEKNTVHLSLTCDPSKILLFEDEVKNATQEMAFQEGMVKSQTVKEMSRFVLKKNKAKKTLISVSSVFLPLFEKTLE